MRVQILQLEVNEERIGLIAGHQRGRVARRQLLAAGISSSTIAWYVERGRLHPRLRGVFVYGHRAPIELGDETLALLAVRDGAALSHVSAAALWGLIGPEAGPVHVVVGAGRSARASRVLVHRSTTLIPKDIRIHQGLPVTSPARALLDSAPLLSDRRLELAYDRALVDKLARRAQITDVLDRAGSTRVPRWVYVPNIPMP